MTRSILSKQANDEQVVAFQLDKPNVHGRLARLDGLVGQILQQHAYPLNVATLVTEAVLITALVGQNIKSCWKLSLQIHSDGAINMIVADYYAPPCNGQSANMRAYARYKKKYVNSTYKNAFKKIGNGYIAFLIDTGNGVKPFRQIGPLLGKSLSHCTQIYFSQFEKLPTQFYINVTPSKKVNNIQQQWRATGVMLQQRQSKTRLTSKTNRLTDLMTNMATQELINNDYNCKRLIHKTFYQQSPHILTERKLHFACHCSANKVRQTLSIYSKKDIEKMTTSAGVVTADCQYCGAHYYLDPAKLGKNADSG